MALTSGTKLGPYEIQSPLGAGGMGEVYRARDTRLDRTVAVKILPSHLSSNPDAKQRFEREARAISSLNHPNICILYDVGHQDGVDFLVMEFLEGETLADRLMKGPLPPEQVLKCGIEICDGLEKAHRSGVVHRDLKPGNIMLTKAGAKLMDFGLAKTSPMGLVPSSNLTMTLSAPSRDQPLTAQGMLLGTFQYMSPEQVEGKEADPRSDIFALGAVLYEMTTGKRAFEGTTTASVIAAILERDPEPINKVQPLSPPALSQAVKTCLAKDPDERFQNVHDLKLQLKWIAESESQVRESASTATKSSGGWRERIAWAIAACALVLAGISHFRQQPTQTLYSIHSSILPPEKVQFLFSGSGGGTLAISPDGTQVVFGGVGADGRPKLWLRSLKNNASLELANTEAASDPFWSPDSHSVGFFAEGKLKRIEVTGGPALVLCDAPAGRGGSWSQEGTIVFARERGSPLYRIPAAGGTAAPATVLDARHNEAGHRWPFFLPDGRHFLYLAFQTTRDRPNVFVASLDSQETVPVITSDSNVLYAPQGYLLFVRQQTLMAQPFDATRLRTTGDPVPIGENIGVGARARAPFSVSDNGILAYYSGLDGGTEQFLWFDRSGRQVGAVKALDVNFSGDLSRDGLTLAIPISDPHPGSSDIWLCDLAHGTRNRFTFNQVSNTNPIWSPDERRIAFASYHEGRYQLYQKDASGAGIEELLLAMEGSVVPSAWSADGRYIAFGFTPRGDAKTEGWVLPLFGNRKPIPVVKNGFHLDFSSDGRFLAYSSPESGRYEVYITTFPGGSSKWQVSTAGGASPQWRHDGKELYYLSSDNRIMAAEIGLRGNGLVVGATKPLFQVSVPSGTDRPFQVSADGQRFLVNALGSHGTTTPINLVTNWNSDLKK